MVILNVTAATYFKQAGTAPTKDCGSGGMFQMFQFFQTKKAQWLTRKDGALCETHDCLEDITTSAGEHFIKVVLFYSVQKFWECGLYIHLHTESS